MNSDSTISMWHSSSIRHFPSRSYSCRSATIYLKEKYFISYTTTENIITFATFIHVKLTLTHWSRVTHICVGKLTIISSDNGLSPGRHQAINWTNAGILLIGPKGTKISEILNEIHKFSLKKMHLNVSSAKRRPFCLGLNVLTCQAKIIPANPCQYQGATCTWSLL